MGTTDVLRQYHVTAEFCSPPWSASRVRRVHPDRRQP